MYIKSLELSHYRNYHHLQVSFQPYLNVIVGKNAQGKTNLIEALYYLSLCRSFRTNQDQALIQKEEKYALLLENKGYSSTHNDQLKRYRTIFETHYNGKGFSLKYAYFSCKDQLNDWEKGKCQSAGYRAYTMDQVFDLANPNKDWDYTGNAIFDEFWFTTW